MKGKQVCSGQEWTDAELTSFRARVLALRGSSSITEM
jgi:hypothetical protein